MGIKHQGLQAGSWERAPEETLTVGSKCSNRFPSTEPRTFQENNTRPGDPQSAGGSGELAQTLGRREPGPGGGAPCALETLDPQRKQERGDGLCNDRPGWGGSPESIGATRSHDACERK